MSNQLDAAPNFCAEYVESAGDLVSLAPWFVGAALVLGIVYGIVEAYKKARADGPTTKAGGTLKDLLEALSAFIQSLAAAPAWLGLVAIGVLLILLPGLSSSETCKGEMGNRYWNVDAPSPTTNAGKQ